MSDYIQQIGAVDFTDQDRYTVLPQGTPHRRLKKVDEATDWPLGTSYVVSATGDGHEFEMDVLVWGPSTDNPTRTMEDAQDDFNAVLAQLEAAEQGDVIEYVEQWTGRLTADIFAVTWGTFEETDRDELIGSYLRGHLKFKANLS